MAKICTKCLKTKPLEEFYSCSRNKTDGRQAKCKDCNKDFLYAHRKTDKGKAVQRKYNLKYYFGVTPEWYEKQFNKQEGLCAICKKPDTIRLAVDHNHKTDAVRELLCKKCNTAIGIVNEDLGWFDEAKKYLRKHNG